MDNFRAHYRLILLFSNRLVDHFLMVFVLFFMQGCSLRSFPYEKDFVSAQEGHYLIRYRDWQIRRIRSKFGQAHVTLLRR